ncbi:MAG: M48 family metallopeptidase, partial [Thiobacillus sp.]|nr:M48 family metallopeptidase [Thiobacillus sp.]
MRRARREEAAASLDLPGLRLDYLLKRSSARRTLALKINAQGQAQVNAPLHMPLARIEAFLVQHADWLRGHLEARPAGFVWEEGVLLPYLGGELRLEFASGPVRHQDDCLLAPAVGTESAVLAWYRRQAREVLGRQ